jgi:hypothetical protein
MIAWTPEAAMKGRLPPKLAAPQEPEMEQIHPILGVGRSPWTAADARVGL